MVNPSPLINRSLCPTAGVSEFCCWITAVALTIKTRKAGFGECGLTAVAAEPGTNSAARNQGFQPSTHGARSLGYPRLSGGKKGHALVRWWPTRGAINSVRQLGVRIAYCIPEVGALEMRVLEEGTFEQRSPTVL